MVADMLHAITRSVVRLACEGGFGAGVLVTSGAVLTARHVVDPHLTSTRGEACNASRVAIGSSAFQGIRTPDDFIFPDQPDVDLAIALLRPPKQVDVDFTCPVQAQPGSAVNVGDEVDVAGYASSDGDVQIDQLRILAVHGRAGAFTCNKAIPKGFSGGPVLADGALVGILYARHHDQGQSYFYGGHELSQLLSRLATDEIRWSGPPSALRRYPLGPAVDPVLTSAQLNHFIRACVRLYAGYQAKGVVAAANAARIECGPETGSKGLVDLPELPDPHGDLYGFWYGAVVNAGQKSPRMLAALLEQVGSESLDDKARDEKARVLARLLASNL